jgi:hypothetical protein
MGLNVKEEIIHPSVADIVEHDLVDLILDGPDSYWRSNIFRLKGISDDSVAVRRVPLRDAPGANEGDIDILLCSPNEPWLATAIEVKRIKVGPRAFLTGEPNKLHELETAVFQAEKLVSIGFSQVYLYVLVAVDSREHMEFRRAHSRGISRPDRFMPMYLYSELIPAIKQNCSRSASLLTSVA